MNKITSALINALATAIYIALVGSFMYLGVDGLFERTPTILAPIGMLMLFVFSAAITGFLIFGKPLIWYLDGKKHQALSLLGYTLLFFFILTAIIFVILILIQSL